MVIIFIGIIMLILLFTQNLMYKKFWDKNLFLDVAFSAKEAYEGDILFLKEVLTNKKFLPLPWVYVKFYLSKNLVFDKKAIETTDNHYQADLFSIMPYSRITRRMEFEASRRGFYSLNSINLVASNLLHTQRFVVALSCNTSLIVFPKILDSAEIPESLYKNIDAQIMSNSIINPDPFEFKGIRHYLPTDQLKSINFKASAKAQELMVNIYAPSQVSRVEILLNMQAYSAYYDDAIYEQAIRLSATLAAHYIGEGASVGFFTNGLDSAIAGNIRILRGKDEAHLYQILEALARVANIYTNLSSLAEYIYEQEEQDVIYVLISPNFDDDMRDAFLDAESRSLAMAGVCPWPKEQGRPPELVPNMQLWEV